ncbi:hypothetical protein SEETMRM9437_14800 [Salmonella enterica subsp. enterica serovar Typhimurium]|nr:hypothetical protein SEETMRM9437_14800 [Salmonella enterica subsp. enterica serovar Typhimurium]AQU53594.1 hypothetical protein SEETMRM10607_15830 [Salmonella enterica subsp. enterica serovar Typhimurium]ARE50852.1 Hypothetical protein FORC30_0916 [Salmonella enterica]
MESGINSPVYPRWRGEHDVTDSEIYWDNGLSPLARGTRNVNRVRYNSARFIPAGAGNTVKGGLEGDRQTVYPRWRGEHTKRI